MIAGAPGLDALGVVGFVVDLELGGVATQPGDDGRHLDHKICRAGARIRAEAVVVEADNELKAGVFALEPRKNLDLGEGHHLDGFDARLADKPIVGFGKAIVISRVNPDPRPVFCHLTVSFPVVESKGTASIIL